jgi:hypothetical protein
MTAEQAATLKHLAKAAYELDAFKPNLTRAEADLRTSQSVCGGPSSSLSLARCLIHRQELVAMSRSLAGRRRSPRRGSR